jgi:hypothetical protein
MGLQVDILVTLPITGDDQVYKKQVVRALREVDGKTVTGSSGSFGGSVTVPEGDTDIPTAPDPVFYVVRGRKDGETTDGPAFDEALAAAAGNGVVMWPRGRNPVLPGAHQRRRGTMIDFNGNVVQHTGDNVMLRCTAIDTVGAEFAPGRGAVMNGTFIGNSGSNAVCLELGNSYGFLLRNITIVESYTNGIGIDLQNTVNWCEGVVFDDVVVNMAKTGLRIIRSASSFIVGQPPMDSFAYMNMAGLSINVPAGEVGIDFIGTSGHEIHVYNSVLAPVLWLRQGSIGIRVSNYVTVDRNRFDIRWEAMDGATAVTLFSTTAGAQVTGFGYCRTISTAESTYHTGTGRVAIASPTGDGSLDSRNGTRSSMRIRIAATSDNDDLTNYAYRGRMAWEDGANTERPVFAGYNGGQDVARFYGIEFGSPAVADWKLYFGIANGRITIGGASGTDVVVFRGTGSPAGVVVANRGSTFHRTDGGSGTCFYVKESGDGTSSGWVAK